MKLLPLDLRSILKTRLGMLKNEQGIILSIIWLMQINVADYV